MEFFKNYFGFITSKEFIDDREEQEEKNNVCK